MFMQLRFTAALMASLASAVMLTATVNAQLITGFEAPEYTLGTLNFQDNWVGGATWPHVQSAAGIEAELLAAGLNVGQTTHSGDQALMVTKVDTATEGGGYFVRDLLFGLETETKVTVDWWARPLTSGAGADPSGTPAGNNQIIGERQGNTFIGIMDDAEVRAGAVRFGIVVEPDNPNPYTNAQFRTIDYASASAGSTVWVPSGLSWSADNWYNFRMEMDYEAKKYDFFVDDVKVNAEPIRFYTETSAAATKFFVSRGTNQAGQIIDDISVDVTGEAPAPGPGDFDEDGDVDGHDLMFWQRGGSPDPLSVADLEAWQNNYPGGGEFQAVSVPEPCAGLLVLGIGLTFAGLRKRGR
jgi:hypothetical protein